MKKLIIIAAVAATGLGAALAAEDGQGTARNWRLTVGGFGRGSMKAQMEGFGTKRTEVYGADLDARYRAFRMGAFSLWTGLGGTFTPFQHLASDAYRDYSSDGYSTFDLNGAVKTDVSAGELRLMLVPEYALTERWSVAARVGVAFDWIRLHYRAQYWGQATIGGFAIPVGPVEESGKDTDFVAQAVLGLETTYMLTDSFGLYANVDYRCGGNATFEADGDRLGELNLDGWCAGVGAVVSF